VDTFVSPFNIGFGCVVTGTATYSMEHSFDGVNWFLSAVNSTTTNQDGNYAFPVQYVRLIVTAGTGTVVCTLIEAGVNAT
jgi:hypothetical protein